MKTKCASRLILALALAASTCGVVRASHAGTRNEAGTITIYVYDYADAKPTVLLQAERAAAGFLEKAGVETVWVDCLRDDASPRNLACVASADPTHLILRVLPDSMSKHLRQVHGDALGFAALGERFNCNAWIFYGRVKDFSLEQQLTLERVLGAVIAHELGHLLLDENAHANTGLMHGYWTSRELFEIESARLIFSDTESKRIQSGVIARHQALSLIAAGVSRFTKVAFAGEPTATVLVYNHAHVSPAILAEAEREAARILGAAGVRAIWLECTMRPRTASAEGPCSRKLESTDIMLRVVPTPIQNSFEDNVFGFAVHPVWATVYYDSVVDLAKRDNAKFEVPLIFGGVIAHELGHLLLGSNSHSSEGIMQPRWERKAVRQLMMGTLLFTPEQAKLLRAEARTRMRLRTGTLEEERT